MNAAISASLDTSHGTEILLSGSRKPRAVQKCGDTQSFFLCSDLVFLGEAQLLRFVIRKIECAVKKFSEIDLFVHDLFGGRCLPGLQKVPAPNLRWRKAHNLRDTIYMSFDREYTLRRPEAAKGAMGRSIRG